MLLDRRHKPFIADRAALLDRPPEHAHILLADDRGSELLDRISASHSSKAGNRQKSKRGSGFAVPTWSK